jgi:hypothetical protein
MFFYATFGENTFVSRRPCKHSWVIKLGFRYRYFGYHQLRYSSWKAFKFTFDWLHQDKVILNVICCCRIGHRFPWFYENWQVLNRFLIELCPFDQSCTREICLIFCRISATTGEHPMFEQRNQTIIINSILFKWKEGLLASHWSPF